MKSVKDIEEAVLGTIKDSSKDKVKVLFKEMEEERSIITEMLDNWDIPSGGMQGLIRAAQRKRKGK